MFPFPRVLVYVKVIIIYVFEGDVFSPFETACVLFKEQNSRENLGLDLKIDKLSSD